MDRLTHPKDYGLIIRPYQCLSAKAPCLLVEPDAIAGVGQRGKKLRNQLAQKQFELPAYGRVKGTIVLLHGRKGRKEDLLRVAERFVAVGFRCLLIDMPAHSDSPIDATSFGESLFERGLQAQALKEVRKHFALPDEPAALWGMSVGVLLPLLLGSNKSTFIGEFYLIFCSRAMACIIFLYNLNRFTKTSVFIIATAMINN